MINRCLFLSLLLFETIHSNPVVQTNKDATAYLTRYGYALQQCGHGKLACMMGGQNLGSMIKDFQRQFKLRVTGKLDSETKQFMNQPRCGVADRKSSLLSVQGLNADDRWSHRRLTWSFRHEDSNGYQQWIEEAFRKWKEIMPQFDFHQVCSTCKADINLSFQQAAHGHEGHSDHGGFEPETLAHAYYPKDGTVHFAFNKKWTHSFEQSNDIYNFYLVAVHEIGHALGYLYKGKYHNVDDRSSIMFPNYANLGKDNLFTEADKQMMRNMYPSSSGEGGSSGGGSCPGGCAPGECCSKWGYCGNTAEHCDGQQPSPGGNEGGKINWNGNNWALACDFHEKNLANVKTKPDLCGPECARTLGCSHFTWTQYNGGTCWMKKGGVSKSDAFYTNDQSMVCGVAISD